MDGLEGKESLETDLSPCQLSVAAGVVGVARLRRARQPRESPFVGLASLHPHIPRPGSTPSGASRAAPLRGSGGVPHSQTRLPLVRYHGVPAAVGQRKKVWQGSRAEPTCDHASGWVPCLGGFRGRWAAGHECTRVAAGADGHEERDCPPGLEPKFVLAFGKGRYFPLPPPPPQSFC